MLDTLFGSRTAEMVFFYLLAYKKGYARRIASVFGMSLNSVQKQLLKFEKAGVLVSFLEGRTRIFQWNPRYPFLTELQALLEKAFQYLPEPEKSKYFKERTRPRRTGKPL
ncbi:MAG: winged helix-turn-helix transcriptional regulator [Proteobacteria bacterium]|nr:winged helix-turn-helix transcriptional regulator [Pseudomonadota bacterium]